MKKITVSILALVASAMIISSCSKSTTSSKNTNRDFTADSRQDFMSANSSKTSTIAGEQNLVASAQPVIIAENLNAKLPNVSVETAKVVSKLQASVKNNNGISKADAKAFYKANKKEIKKAAAAEKAMGGKSQIVALILAIVIGGLGIHRFYLGYIGAGVIQLLTAGGCGIWSLIDIIRIAMGTLKPKGGDYDQKF